MLSRLICTCLACSLVTSNTGSYKQAGSDGELLKMHSAAKGIGEEGWEEVVLQPDQEVGQYLGPVQEGFGSCLASLTALSSQVIRGSPFISMQTFQEALFTLQAQKGLVSTRMEEEGSKMAA